MQPEIWPENFVPNEVPSCQLIDEFERAIQDAENERPLQHILAANSVLLRPLLHSASEFWCFDRPRFGSELIPDFLLCFRNSLGFNWIMLELESPTKKILNANGRRSAALIEAQGQVDDWRVWLRKNIAYAQNELGFRQIDAECKSWIIIGRRHQIKSKLALKYRELSSHSDQVMSYDRILDAARSAIK